jgi:hypothetical protein
MKGVDRNRLRPLEYACLEVAKSGERGARTGEDGRRTRRRRTCSVRPRAPLGASSWPGGGLALVLSAGTNREAADSFFFSLPQSTFVLGCAVLVLSQEQINGDH